MMSLQEVIRAVDQLSAEELAQLRVYIHQRELQIQPAHSLSPAERINRMDEAVRAIREGFTAEQWADVEQAMNEEYIQTN